MGPVRRSEIEAALAVAAGAGMGYPPDLSLSSAAVAALLARAAGLSDADVRACHEVALLRFAGCTAESELASRVFGDEVDGRRVVATADFGYPASVMSTAVRGLHAEAPLASSIDCSDSKPRWRWRRNGPAVTPARR